MNAPEHFTSLSRDALLVLVAEQQRQIAEQQRQMAELTARIEALQAEVERLTRGARSFPGLGSTRRSRGIKFSRLAAGRPCTTISAPHGSMTAAI